MEPVIVSNNLSRQFGAVTAVDGVSLEVYPGEVFGLLGPNGAGKTTTIRMLTCLIAQSAGSARVCGYDITKNGREIRRQTGLLTETPGLYDNLSAEKNLQIFARLYGMNDPQKQVEKYLNMLGLYDRRFDLTATYSRGMKQKLAIARALLHEPRLIFLDEPTTGLDPEAAHKIRDFIEVLRSQGRTVILCTHNLDEADRLCDRIGVIKNRLLVVDSQANLRTKLFGHRIVFHLEHVHQDYCDRIMKLPDIEDIQVIENRLLVTVDNPDRQNPEIIRLLVDAGADIQFVGELKKTLEDVYLHFVNQKTAEVAG